VGHNDGLVSLAWSPSGKTLLSGSADNTVRLWDAESGKVIKILAIEAGRIFQVAWSPDGDRLASLSNNDGDIELRLWDADGVPGPVFVEPGAKLSPLYFQALFAWHADGRRIAVSGGKVIKIYSALDGRCEHILEGHSGEINWLAWSPDGKWIASGGGQEDPTVRLWDAKGNAGPVLRAYSAVEQLAISSDSRWLAIASGYNVELWDLVEKRYGPLLFHACATKRVCFSADGRYVFSTGHDKTIRRWDASTGEPLSTTIRLPNGQAGYVTASGNMETTSPKAEDEFVYVTERRDGELKLHNPAEFRKLYLRKTIGDSDVDQHGK
jgi:WD40 repeat protein